MQPSSTVALLVNIYIIIEYIITVYFLDVECLKETQKTFALDHILRT